MSTCKDPEIFARMVGGPSPTDRKEPWKHFSPQLILLWEPNGYFKGTIIFEESRRGGHKFQGVHLFFQGDGAKLHFSIETYRTRCSPGGGGGGGGGGDGSRIAYVHVSMFVVF